MSRFASWEEVCAHLSVRGKLRALDGGRVEVTLAMGPYAAPGASESRLTLAKLDLAGAPWLELVAVIGSAKSVPITNILHDNAQAAIGVFCFVDGELALRQTLPLEGLRVADLDRVVKVMGWRVTETRKHLGLV